MGERIGPLSEFEITAQRIGQARHPEEIFGALEGDQLKTGRSVYRSLSKLIHPDLYLGGSEESLAQEAFKKLSALWGETQEKLKRGSYGIMPPDSNPTESVIIKTRRKEYEVTGTPFQADFANLYRCNFTDKSGDHKGVFKVVRDPADNDLLENEARILKVLSDGEGHEKFYKYVPALVDSFIYRDRSDPTPRHGNVFMKDEDEYFSLEEIREQYQDGIDPKDMAWIWRRFLVGLGYAHLNKVIHGGVVPSNIFVQPEKHGFLINEWSYAVLDPEDSDERISALSRRYEGFYPKEVFNKELPTPGLDISMGAKNMVYLLGGQVETGDLPSTVNPRIRAFFKGCMLEHPWQRPQDAWKLLEEFDQLIEGLWGPRKFHPFGMPRTASTSPYR